MKLSTVAVFGAGYVLGTRAGHQRYEQLRAAARRMAGELDSTSIRSGLETVASRLEHYAGAHASGAGSDGSPTRGAARR